MVTARTSNHRMIFLDTNTLRCFGKAFATTCLPTDLRMHLLLPPLSAMELLSQLATDGAEDAFASVQAMLRIFSPTAGMLPWLSWCGEDVNRARPLRSTLKGASHYCLKRSAVIPPSTMISDPVTNPAWSLPRNATISPISRGVPNRPIG